MLKPFIKIISPHINVKQLDSIDEKFIFMVKMRQQQQQKEKEKFIDVLLIEYSIENGISSFNIPF